MAHEPEAVRRKPRFVTEPGDAELGYLAGIIDGEGHLFAYAMARTRVRRAQGVTVQMNDEVVIDWLHEHFHGFKSQSRTGIGTPTYRWTLQRYADLAFLLPRLVPHLVAKRAQAQALLALVEHLLDPPTRHYAIPTQKISSVRANDRERARRRRLRAEHRTRAAELAARVRAMRHVCVDASQSGD